MKELGVNTLNDVNNLGRKFLDRKALKAGAPVALVANLGSFDERHI